MIYRIVATVLLLAALGAAVVLFPDEGSSSTSVPVTASPDPDSAAMKSLRIE